MPTGHYDRKTPKVTINCETCGKEMVLTPSQYKRPTKSGSVRFCSSKCFGDSLKGVTTKVTLTCDHCGNPFEKDRHRVKPRNFCSKKCTYESRKVEGAKWRDPEYIRQYHERYHSRNRDRVNFLSRQWRKNNLAKKQMIQLRYRTKRRELPSTLTQDEWIRCLEYWHGCCAYCGTQRDFWHPMEQDHYTPLSHGGAYAVDNILPACRSCNPSKSDRDATEWIKWKFKRKAKSILERITEYFEWCKSQN